MAGDIARLMLAVDSSSIPVAERQLQALNASARTTAFTMASLTSQSSGYTTSLGGILVPSRVATKQLADMSVATRNVGVAMKESHKDFTDMFRDLLNAREGTAGLIGGFLRLSTGAYLASRAIGTVGDMVAGVIRPFIENASAIESMTASYNALLGSTVEGGGMVGFLKTLATTTPVAMKGMSDGTKTLLGFGFTANEVKDVLPKLAKVAQGNSEAFQHLAVVYGQVRAQGKMYMNDMRQFTNAGVPMIEALAEVMNAPQAEIGNMIRDGKVGLSQTKSALELLTQEGGRFHNTLTAAAQTLEGRLTTAANQFKLLFAEGGRGASKLIGELVGSAGVWAVAARAGIQIDALEKAMPTAMQGKRMPIEQYKIERESILASANYIGDSRDPVNQGIAKDLINRIAAFDKRYGGATFGQVPNIMEGRSTEMPSWVQGIPNLRSQIDATNNLSTKDRLSGDLTSSINSRSDWERSQYSTAESQIAYARSLANDELAKSMGFDALESLKTKQGEYAARYQQYGYSTSLGNMDPVVEKTLRLFQVAIDEMEAKGDKDKHGVYKSNQFPYPGARDTAPLYPTTDPYGLNNTMRAAYTGATGNLHSTDMAAKVKELEYIRDLLGENTKEGYAMDEAIKQATKLDEAVAKLQKVYDDLGMTKTATYEAARALITMREGFKQLITSGTVELFQTLGKSMYQASQGAGDFASAMEAFMASLVQQSGALMINAGLALICTGHIVAGLALLALGGLTSIVGSYMSEDAADNGNSVARDAAYAADLLQWYLQAEAFNRQGYKETAALTGYAGGTSFAPGGFAEVGEFGREIMYVPRGAQIIPNNKLQHYGSGVGGGITVVPKVIVNNYASGATATKRTLSNGDVIVTVANAIRKGAFDNALASRKGRSMGN